MKIHLLVLGLSVFTALAQAADPETTEAGKKLERTACLPCHSLRLVESQRLSSAAWTREMDKMIGWGAVVPERQKLIDYLAQEYSDTRPVPPPDKSAPERSGTR